MGKNKILVFPALLLFSSMSNAAFIESLDGSFNQSLQVSGTITNNSPNWSWQLDPGAQASLQNIQLRTSDATTSSGVTTWRIPGRVPLLDGLMARPASSGGPGLQPEIDVAGTAIDMEKNTPQQLSIPVVGVNGANNYNGTLILDLTLGFTNTYTFGSGNIDSHIYTSAGSELTPLERRAFSFLSPAIASIKANNPGLNDATQSSNTGNRYKSMTASTSHNVVGALSTELTNMRVTFPSTSIPQTWSAPVNITVSIK
ncbi:TPA: hypothetical protein ACGUWK_001025 [Vibrio vulnificus]